jgi:hypothetical protein
MEEENESEMRPMVWELKIGNKSKVIELWKLKKATESSFAHMSNNYKQKLVYNLLEAAKNNDQSNFFYLLLKSINKPNEDFTDLWANLNDYYDILPEDAFANFAYSIIIGIMNTYNKGGK